MRKVQASMQQVSDKFPCPECGNTMLFSPEEQCLTCNSCDHTIKIPREGGVIIEHDMSEAYANAVYETDKDIRTVRCTLCGTQVSDFEDVQSRFCAFCGSLYVERQETDRAILPQYMHTFTITKKQALIIFKKWALGHPFAPGQLRRNVINAKIKGVYLPFWTYDTETSTLFRINQGKNDISLESLQKNNDGECRTFFDDILVNGSRIVGNEIINNLGDIKMKSLIIYNDAFLSGFLVERYMINLQDGWTTAKAIIKSKMEEVIRIENNIADSERIDMVTDYKNVRYKHVLIPVWLSSFRFKDTIYTFAINGSTGKTAGRAPVSFSRIAGLTIAAVTIAGIITGMLLFITSLL